MKVQQMQSVLPTRLCYKLYQRCTVPNEDIKAGLCGSGTVEKAVLFWNPTSNGCVQDTQTSKVTGRSAGCPQRPSAVSHRSPPWRWSRSECSSCSQKGSVQSTWAAAQESSAQGLRERPAVLCTCAALLTAAECVHSVPTFDRKILFCFH